MGTVIAIISAPTNLGLRPPTAGSTPGTYKAPEALREAGLYRRLIEAGALDRGIVLPGRYIDDDTTRPHGQVRNHTPIVEHARRLGARIGEALEHGNAPLVLGGDCSILIGAGLGIPATSGAGLIHLDGHTDFRHPGNSDDCASLAGEDLAAAIGLHWPAIADIDGRAPYFPRDRVAHLGCRDDDGEADEARQAIAALIPAAECMKKGIPASAARVAEAAGGTGYWLQLDVDILDPRWMNAVDSPDPGGLDPQQLVELLQLLAPNAIGASVTVFDPDLDPTGSQAALLADIIEAGLGTLGERILAN